MWRHYPLLVRSILASRGMDGTQPHPDLIYVEGKSSRLSTGLAGNDKLPRAAVS
jgi:hypothetical protein